MGDFLRDVGGVYVLSSAIILIGGLIDRTRRRKPIDFGHVLTGLGIAGVLVWFIVGLGLASWVVSLPFAALR